MLPIILLVAAGIYVGWNIGANDTANCIGTAVGSGLISYSKAVILIAIFIILGASIQGERVIETIGKGIVTEIIPVPAIIIALLSAGAFVTIATYLKLPVSTSQAIVGGVTGVSLSVGANVAWNEVLSIILCWIINPIATLVIAYGLYHILNALARRVRRIRVWERFIIVLLVVTISYMAYSLGANHAGNAVGPIANLGIIKLRWLAIIGGLSIALGSLTYGHRVSETVGKSITLLDPITACAAQLSIAIVVHMFSILGIPVSTSQAIVGGVIGVGLVRGVTAINRDIIIKIIIGWIATPLISAILAFSIYKVVT